MIDKVQNSNVGQLHKNRTDVGSTDNYKYIPEDFKNVAKGMETQFLEFMITQMNKTVDHAEAKGTAQDYYENLLVNERAKAMSTKNEGSGIQKMILDQIYPQRFRNKYAYNAYINKQDSDSVIRKTNSPGKNPELK